MSEKLQDRLRETEDIIWKSTKRDVGRTDHRLCSFLREAADAIDERDRLREEIAALRTGASQEKLKRRYQMAAGREARKAFDAREALRKLIEAAEVELEELYENRWPWDELTLAVKAAKEVLDD